MIHQCSSRRGKELKKDNGVAERQIC